MTVLTKKKNGSRTRTKTKINKKSNRKSKSRKNLNKSRKNGLKTRTNVMRGGSYGKVNYDAPKVDYGNSMKKAPKPLTPLTTSKAVQKRAMSLNSTLTKKSVKLHPLFGTAALKSLKDVSRRVEGGDKTQVYESLFQKKRQVPQNPYVQTGQTSQTGQPVQQKETFSRLAPTEGRKPYTGSTRNTTFNELSSKGRTVEPLNLNQALNRLGKAKGVTTSNGHVRNLLNRSLGAPPPSNPTRQPSKSSGYELAVLRGSDPNFVHVPIDKQNPIPRKYYPDVSNNNL